MFLVFFFLASALGGDISAEEKLVPPETIPQRIHPALASFLANRPRATLFGPLETTPSGCTRGSFNGVTWQGGNWTHPFLLCTAKELRHKDAVLLRISGTQNPDKYEFETQAVANRSHAHVFVLGGVPNQPLFGGKKEDALLAFSFERYRITGDSSWPVLLPMVASVISAIDIVEEHLRSTYEVKNVRVVTTGASKRGWTTWLSGAVDKRIIGIAPAVFDMLDIPAQVAHARKAYGKDSRMIRAYTELGLTDKLTDPRMIELMRMIDPYSYLDQLSIPKLLILGTNDPYWVVDSLTLYEQDLKGNVAIVMQPNTGHGALGTRGGLEVVGTWFSLLAAGGKSPDVRAQLVHSQLGASVSFHANYPMKSIRVWSADSDDLDFRLSRWEEVDSGTTAGSTHMVPYPRYGLRGVLVEGVLETSKGELRVTSPAYVIGPRSTRKPYEDS